MRHIAHHKVPRPIFPSRETLTVSDAMTDEGLRERPADLISYEARVLADYYLAELVDLEAEQELLDLHDGTSTPKILFIERRIDKLVDAGLLPLKEVRSRYRRARELRGLHVEAEVDNRPGQDPGLGDRDGGDLPDGYDVATPSADHTKKPADEPVHTAAEFDWSEV